MARQKQKKPRKPLTIKIVDRKLGREAAAGLNHFDSPLVEIDPRQTSFDRLDTLIHEVLHKLFPYRSEDCILHAGTTIAKAVWKDRYRRMEK
jgi:hypothetical protein